MRVLVVEDEPLIAEFVAKGLRESGHSVDLAATGPEGLHLANTEAYDALVLDRMLPGLEGLALLRDLRSRGHRTPALILSSLGDVEQRVEGLRGGADDYLAKPFAFVELMARLEGLWRRQSSDPGTGSKLRVADLEIDLLKRSVKRGGESLELQPR
jgi:two-component system OmpR family response regulator